jgi:predicted nucleotidyltransferase
MTNTNAGTLHKELSTLARAGILTSERRGNQLFYRANPGCPIFEELTSILRKTSGLATVIALALEPLASRITSAFVFGSVAQARESSDSDVDVMVIGEISFSEVVNQLYSTQLTLGREINPKVFAISEWKERHVAGDPFVQDVLRKPKIFLIGNDHDLKEFGGH